MRLQAVPERMQRRPACRLAFGNETFVSRTNRTQFTNNTHTHALTLHYNTHVFTGSHYSSSPVRTHTHTHNVLTRRRSLVDQNNVTLYGGAANVIIVVINNNNKIHIRPRATGGKCIASYYNTRQHGIGTHGPNRIIKITSSEKCNRKF